MESFYKSASWTPAYYGMDQSFAKGLMDVIFVIKGQTEDFDVKSSDDATAIKAIVYSISHQEYEEIEGVYNDGLDLYIVMSDGSTMIVNGEENPGEIHGSNKTLSPEPFILRLRNPVETGVTLLDLDGFGLRMKWVGHQTGNQSGIERYKRPCLVYRELNTLYGPL